MASWKRKLLWSLWALSMALALASMAVFVQGILRDHRTGEPVLEVDLSSQGDWRTVPFRVWGSGTYRLFISSVNHNPQLAGARLEGDFEISVVDPEGKIFFHRAYAAGAANHVLTNDYSDSQLEKLALADWPLRAWILKARVLRPDSRFKTAHTQVKLWKERYDPGMGGLMNYVMIIPAGFFLLLSFLASLGLAANSSRAPLIVTFVFGLIFLAFFIA